eukprot:Nitzschia sp. Nitz4//scaffold140_size61219//5791//6339//NITZ4_006430-RA/size61219-processed-gene-0.41-mRNA-1//1//CDS//3329536197//8751//frame0
MVKSFSCSAEIIPGLWIGSLGALSSLEADEKEWLIVTILNGNSLIAIARSIVQRSEATCVEHEVWKLPDISIGDFLSPELSRILSRMDHYIENGERACLVHCARGISRSAAVCTAWLLSRRELSLEQATDKIRAVRPQMAPNMGFVASLKALEKCSGDVEKAKERMMSRRKTSDNNPLIKES